LGNHGGIDGNICIIQRAPTSSSYIIIVYLHFIFTIRDIRDTPKVGFISLGCPKALVDSERILTQLRIDGYEMVLTLNTEPVSGMAAR